MDYDIIIIGAGSGGIDIASFMNKAGFKTLLIDKTEFNIGGNCLNYESIPSKALIHVARIIDDSKKAKNFGLQTKGSIDLKKIMDYIKSRQDKIRKHENAEYFRLLGIDVELGTAKFVDNNSIRINNKIYRAKKIILATGSRPKKLNIQGISKINQLNSENIFNLKKLPKKLVIIGGGSIGIEIGQSFNMLGSKVTIINQGPQILPKEDYDISNIMHEELREQGISIYLNSNPKKFSKKNELIIENEDSIEEKIGFDEIFVSVGRDLNIENLGLQKANIEIKNNKIIVDKYLQTTNKNVLLCGDIVGSYQFTHIAKMHANLILTNFFNPIKKKINYDNISWVTYTTPEIATFGLNPSQIDKRKINYKRLEIGFNADDRAIIDDYTKGKTIIYLSGKKILGGTMIAKNASELIQELILTKTSRLSIKKIFKKTYAYPVASRINKKLITTFYLDKLTRFNKKLLRLLY